jgi:hypothetical protein
VLLPGHNTGHNSLAAQVQSLALSEQDLTAAVAAAQPSSSKAGNIRQLQECIEQLDVLKDLLVVRRQQKTQEIMLKHNEQQQQQQQPLLSEQHVMLNTGGSAAQQFMSESSQLQHELLQMLQRHQGEGGVLQSGPHAHTAGVVFHDTASMPEPHCSSQAAFVVASEPALVTWLQQQQQQQGVQYSPHVLQSQDVGSLGSMLQAQLCLQAQQVQQAGMSSPALLMPQGPHQVIMLNTAQGMGVYS